MYTAGKVTATNFYARSFSWGLLQCMGEDAREDGYTGDLAQLCNPAMGLEWGCRRFAKILREADENVDTALQRWNGSGNPNYAGEVMMLAKGTHVYIENPLQSSRLDVGDLPEGRAGRRDKQPIWRWVRRKRVGRTRVSIPDIWPPSPR